MADMKASALPIAAPLTGAELWAAVQSGDDHKVTADQIAAYAAQRCGQVVHQSAVQQSITGTTTETTLASFTIPANSLGANGSADFLMLFGVTDSMFGLRDVEFLGLPLGFWLGILVVLLAAYSLVLDFDSIKTGVERGAPAAFGWTAAFGIMVTVVWLYVEILRILAILRGGE